MPYRFDSDTRLLIEANGSTLGKVTNIFDLDGEETDDIELAVSLVVEDLNVPDGQPRWLVIDVADVTKSPRL